MSHHSENLNNKFVMCPCSNDIPKTACYESEPVESGFEVLSGDSGSDEEQDALGAQGYVPLPQNEDETIPQDTIQTQQVSLAVINQPDEEQTHIDRQPKPEEAEVEMSNDVTSSSCAFSSTDESRMGEDEIDLIKSVMMNIKLPNSSIPEWAKRIPDEKWKTPLVSSVQQQSESEKSTDRKSS